MVQDLDLSIRQLVRLQNEHAEDLRGASFVAQRQFQAWREDYDQRWRAPRPVPHGPGLLRPAITMAVALVAAAGLFVLGRKQPSGPLLEPTVARVRQAEARLRDAGAIVRQEFSIEITQVQPAGRKRSSRLEVWADGDRRFSARWAVPEGGLKFAAWQPASSRRYVLEPAVAGRVVPVAAAGSGSAALAECLGEAADGEAIEAGFLRWLRSRKWSPVLLGEDMAELRSGGGERVRIERLESDGATVVRVSASRSGWGAEVEVLFEIDPATDRVRVQQVRIRDRSREAVLRISAHDVRMIPARDDPATARAFEPPLPALPVAAREPSPAVSFSSAAEAADVSPGGILESRVELLELLHRIGAEVGEELAVGRRPDGGLIIEGMVDTARRREQIQALVEKRLGRDLVTLRLNDAETGPSAAEFRSLAWNPPAIPQPAEAADVLLGEAIELVPGVVGAGSRQEYVRRLAELHWSAVTEVWSLRMLSQVMLPWEEARLTEPTRNRLRQMVESHRSSLIDTAKELHASV